MSKYLLNKGAECKVKQAPPHISEGVFFLFVCLFVFLDTWKFDSVFTVHQNSQEKQCKNTVKLAVLAHG